MVTAHVDSASPYDGASAPASKPNGRNAFANRSRPAQSTGSPPLMANRTRPRSTSDTSRAYLPIML
jgi:hypothetical protein